jgi:hypothetical protein
MKLKLEKINMKWVIGIGIGIILILTVLFILFRTNLIFENTSGNNNNGEKEPNGGYCEDEEDCDEPDIPDDPDELGRPGLVSQEARDRTKPAYRLTPDEKLFIIEENLRALIEENKESNKERCAKMCRNDTATTLRHYRFSEERRANVQISGCRGFAYWNYDSDKGEFIIDLSNVKCT